MKDTGQVTGAKKTQLDNDSFKVNKTNI